MLDIENISDWIVVKSIYCADETIESRATRKGTIATLPSEATESMATASISICPNSLNLSIVKTIERTQNVEIMLEPEFPSLQLDLFYYRNSALDPEDWKNELENSETKNAVHVLAPPTIATGAINEQDLLPVKLKLTSKIRKNKKQWIIITSTVHKVAAASQLNTQTDSYNYTQFMLYTPNTAYADLAKGTDISCSDIPDANTDYELNAILINWYHSIHLKTCQLFQEPNQSSSLLCDFIVNDSLRHYFNQSLFQFNNISILYISDINASKLKNNDWISYYAHESGVDILIDYIHDSIYLDREYSFQLSLDCHFYGPNTNEMEEEHEKYGVKTPDSKLELLTVEWIWECIETQCPVCLDMVHFKDTVTVTCGHRMCTECTKSYISSLMDSFDTFGSKFPFTCVIPTCKTEFSFSIIEKFSKPIHFSSFKEYWLSEGWKMKALGLPNIAICPKRKCHSENMRRLIPHSPLVYCDTCGETWCERCLKCLKGMHECDETDVQTFCFNYIALEDDSPKKKDIDRRHPWIKAYVSWKRTDEASLLEWISKNASQCPSCGLGIEKTFGCFHMECVNCHTHYCYHCKKQFDPMSIYRHECFQNPDIFLDNFAF